MGNPGVPRSAGGNAGRIGVETFVPPLAYIVGITNALFPTVTFSEPHDYTPGEYISFRVSKPYGMKEINNQRLLVLSIETLTVVVNGDTTHYTPFVYPVTAVTSPAITVPAGTGIIPGSFPPSMNIFDVYDCLEPS